MGACSSKTSESESSAPSNQVAQDPGVISSVSALAVDVAANPVEAAILINKAIHSQRRNQNVCSPTTVTTSINSSTDAEPSPRVSPVSGQQKNSVQVGNDSAGTSSISRRLVRVVSPGSGSFDSVKKSCRADPHNKQVNKNLFDLSVDVGAPNATVVDCAVVVEPSGVGSFKGASPASVGRRLLQYPSERELSTHRENSLKLTPMHRRAGSVSRATESESDEETEVDGVNAGNQGNNASVRLLNSAKPVHGRKISLSGVNSSLPANGKDSPSQHHSRRLSSYDSTNLMNVDLDVSSPRNVVVSPPQQPPRTLGLRTDSNEPLTPNMRKRELSLAHQVLQRHLLASEMNQPQQHERQSSDEEVPRSPSEYAPPPYQLGGANSPLLSFRRLPSRSRQNSISISANAVPGSPHHNDGSYSSQLLAPPAVDSPTNKHIVVGQNIPQSIPSSPFQDSEERAKESISEQKVEKVWAHYTGSREAKEMGKKGLYQLGSDVYDEFCARYKERMMAIKKEKSDEVVKKGGKPPAPYTAEHAERDLQADLPYMLPANSNRSSKLVQKDYIKYICKFLFTELSNFANSGLASTGKGHQRSRSALMAGNGTGSFRKRANSISQNPFDVAAADIPDSNSGLESFSAASVSVKIRKMEFVLGWKHAQEALFQSIERMKSSSSTPEDSACKLM